MSDLLGSSGIDIEWSDQGTHWRATNRSSRINPATCQELDHISAGGTRSGIRYAIGPDELTNQINILWVDWPKTLFSIDELRNSPQSVKFFAGCNICSAVNQIRSSGGSEKLGLNNSSTKSSIDVVPADLQARQQQVSQSPIPVPVQSNVQPARLSIGDAVLPKYVPVAINLAKSIWLNKLGDAAASIILALGADMVSGFFDDPKYKKAWQCVSDEMVDGVAQCMSDPEYVDQVKSDVSKLVDAYRRDGDILEAMTKSMIRPVDEVLQNVGIEPAGNRRGSSIRSAKLHSYRID